MGREAAMREGFMKNVGRARSVHLDARTVTRVALLCAALATAVTVRMAAGQGALSSGSHGSDTSLLHMEMTPLRAGAPGDSARAASVVATLRTSLAKYADTAAAVSDGYRMFAPEIKQQKVYHFTNGWHAVQEAFRFDPAKPTSILYRKGEDGRFVLIGAMYTAPKGFGVDKLDARVPTSIARWHKHVNWCVPPRGEKERWLERKDGQAVFGPESPIATKAACDAVGGNFHESVFGWMVHANVMQGDDPKVVWGDEHAGHDMHEGMKMGAP